MITFWTNELGAAWTMANLVRDPLWVALVPAAGTLPIFAFATLAGALADIFDRRRIVFVAQAAAAVSSLLLFVLLQLGWLAPPILLGVLLVHGVSFAFRLPSFAAVVSESAPREEFPKAIALNTMATNLARVIGPLLGGAALTFGNASWIFLANAVLGASVLFAVRSWPDRPRQSALPGERLLGAIRLGFRFVRATPAVLVAVNKGAFFFAFSVVTLALLPVLAKGRFAGGSSTYSALMAAFGFGAVCVALRFAWLRQRWNGNQLWLASSIVNISACIALSLTTAPVLAALACLLAGGSWMCVASALQITAQSALPAWVRARGIAVFQTAVMGASAIGAVIWGSVASHMGVAWAFASAAGAGAALTVLMLRKTVREVPSSHAELGDGDIATELAVSVAPERGPVVIAIHFRVPSANQSSFLQLMAESRDSRLRHGAISWAMLRDTADPDGFIEHFVFESWADRLRQIDHVTQADEELRQRKRALCETGRPPVISRWVSEPG